MPQNFSTLNYLTLGCTVLLLSCRASCDEVSDRIQAQQRQQQSDAQQGYMHQQQQQAEADAYWAENGAAIMAAEAERRQQRQAALNDDDFNRTTDWWGAISVNVHTGAWGNSLHRSSGTQAMQDVKSVCPEKDCALLALFRNTCVAGVTNAAGSAFWGAIATGSGGLGLGMGLTEAIAQADALQKCTGDCVIKFSYEGDICIATGTGKTADGKVVTGIDAAKTKALVEASVHKSCADQGMVCTIASVDCLDLTP